MLVDGDEYDTNVRKLTLMGFGNTCQVKEALESSNNDIDSAITFLVNQNFADRRSSFDISIVGGDSRLSSCLNDRFPVNELENLESTLYVEKWNIPCLRHQSLGVCLLASLRLVKKKGVSFFTSVDGVERFMKKCLPECLLKLLVSTAVLQWDADTLEGVHNMLELVIQLTVECLAAGRAVYSASSNPCSPTRNVQSANDVLAEIVDIAFGYLSAIFDLECSYHQRCRDRMTNTGTYLDSFNDYTANLQTPEKGTSRVIYAEVLPAPKNFYLVNLLNCFGSRGGFDLVCWYGTRRYFTLKNMLFVLSPLANVAEYLTMSTMCRYVSWPVARALWLIHNLSPEDFKLQESSVFDLLASLRALCCRFTVLATNNSNNTPTAAAEAPFTVDDLAMPRQPNWDDYIDLCPFMPATAPLFAVSRVDERHLAILLGLLCPPVGVGGCFKVRMLACRHLIDQLSAVQSVKSSAPGGAALEVRKLSSTSSGPTVTSMSILASENQAFLKRRKIQRLIKCDSLMTWVREKGVVQALMTNLDNVTYVAVLCELFRCLGTRITMNDITTLWKRQEIQSHAAINNILKLFSEVGANGFNQEQLEHLFQLVRDSWCALELQSNLRFTRQSVSISGGSKKARRRSRVSSTNISPQHVSESPAIRYTRMRLLNFVATTATTSREPWVSDLCLSLLWQLAQGLHSKKFSTATPPMLPQGKTSRGKFERFVSALSTGKGASGASGISVHLASSNAATAHSDFTEAAMAQMVVVLRDCRLPANEQRQRLNHWLSITTEELKKGKLTYFLLDFLLTVLELICKPLTARNKKDNLRELNKQHNLVDTVCSSLRRLQKQASAKLGTVLNANNDNPDGVNGLNHNDVTNRHLALLQYLLNTADVHLTQEKAQYIWESLADDLGCSSLFGVEKTVCWFASALERLETDAQNNIFTKQVLKLPPCSIQTFTGFQSFHDFFVKVNLNEGRLKGNSESWTVERTDLIGVEFLWDLYTSLPSPPKPTDGQVDGGGVGGGAHNQSLPILITHAGESTRKNPTESLEVIIKNRRLAIHKARKLLLLVSWSQLSNKLKKDPESCHKRFFDYCRKRIELNLLSSSSSFSRHRRPSGAPQGPPSSVAVFSSSLTSPPSQGNVRALLADTGQFLASLLVGPKAAASARGRGQSAASGLALHRLLYIIFSYIENAEDELIGGRQPPSYWKPHYMTFRGWELRIPLRIISPSGQLLVSSTLPLTARCHTTSFSLCLSDATRDYLQNPILIVHSNAPLISVRHQVALIVSACLYTYSNNDTPFCIGSELLSLDPIKPMPIFGLHELSNRHRQTPLSDPKSETPLGHKLDREAIGELGFQTGRTLVIRLRSTSELKTQISGGISTSSMVDSISGSSLRRVSRTSIQSSGVGSSKLNVPMQSAVSSTMSFLPKVASFLHNQGAEKPSTHNSSGGEMGIRQLPFSLPSLMLSSDGSVYESLFSLAESYMVDSENDAPTRAASVPNLLHLTRLLLYCLPTYGQSSCQLSSAKSSKASPRAVSHAFAVSMTCTPANLVKAPQFRLLYLLQVLSGSLVARDSSAWWEHVGTGGIPETPHAISVPSLPLDSSKGLPVRDRRLDEQRINSTLTTSLITSEPCLNACRNTLNKSSLEAAVHMVSTSCPPSPEMSRTPTKRRSSGGKTRRWILGSTGKGKIKHFNEDASGSITSNTQRNDWLEPLVIVLRKQLISGAPLMDGQTTEVSTAPSEGTTRCDDWIRREIKHCALQILATILNPSLLASSPVHSEYSSRASSISSMCNSVASFAQPGFAPKLLSVLLETALASAIEDTSSDTEEDGGCCFGPTSRGGGGGGGGMAGQARQNRHRRRGKMPLVESHSGVANALDPLTSAAGMPLTCQDVEIAVQSIRLVCQCVFSYPAHFMTAFLEMPDLKGSLVKLLLHSPSLRIRSETSHQLEQLFYLFVGEPHQLPLNSVYGLEPCCQLFAWESQQVSSGVGGRTQTTPPYAFDAITIEESKGSPFLDMLLNLLFKTPRDSSNASDLFPPLWPANKIETMVADGNNERRRALARCAEFFMLRGRLFAFVDAKCMQHYGGRDHARLLEKEISWLRTFALAHSQSACWGDALFPRIDCALLNAHFKFVRIACIQLIAMVVACLSSHHKRSHALTCGGAMATNDPASSPAAARWAVCGRAGVPSTCQGLSPPADLLNILQKCDDDVEFEQYKEFEDKEKEEEEEDQATPIHGRRHVFRVPPMPLQTSTSLDSRTRIDACKENPSVGVAARCLRVMREAVPHLLTGYLFPAASQMTQEHRLDSGEDMQRGIGNTKNSNTSCGDGGGSGSLFQPPPKRIDDNARQEVFMLLLLLARMDLHSLEQIVDILTRLHHSHHQSEGEDPTAIVAAAATPKSNCGGANHPSNSPPTTPNWDNNPSPCCSDIGVDVGLTFGSHRDESVENRFGVVTEWNYRPQLVGRANCNFAGLRNGGATCYMNAVLQQLFMQPGVAEAILDVPTARLDSKSLLYQTQELFLNLFFSQLQFYDPVGFWNSFRLWNTDAPIDPHEQQDAFDFFQSFIDQLDESMKKYHEEPFFSRLFHGTLSDTMYCENCGHRYDREQSFSAINLTVCNGDLLEAMRQYTREEVLDGDNAYFCERCQMKQRTLKRLTFSSLPPVICLQLKRFSFDWESQVAVKSNQAFSFPRRLDMAAFMGVGGSGVTMPSVLSVHSSTTTESAHGKRNSTDRQTETPKQGFHLFDGEDDEDQPTNCSDGAASTCVRRSSGGHLPNLQGIWPQYESYESMQNCVYELSGIVIHSGHAHSGHYYSFIRDQGRMDNFKITETCSSRSVSGTAGIFNFGAFQRVPNEASRGDGPSISSQRWLKFNDNVVEEVAMTDELLERECFGGSYLAEVPGRPLEKVTRTSNAYLLFYQRVPAAVSGSDSSAQNRRFSESSIFHSANASRNRGSLVHTERHRHNSAAMPSPSVASVPTPTSRPQGLPLGLSPSHHHQLTHIKPTVSRVGESSSTCLFDMVPPLENGSNRRRIGSNDADDDIVHPTTEILFTTESASSTDEMLHRIRRRNLTFLMQQSIFSADYVSFVYNLAQGVLVDREALPFEPQRAALASHLVVGFLFNTFLTLHDSVKVAISPDLCKRLLAPCAAAAAPGPATTHPGSSTSAAAATAEQQSKLQQEASTKLDTHWMQTLTALTTSSPAAVTWALDYFGRSPSRPLENFVLACPKPLLRHQSARLIGVILNTYFESKDASILDATLNELIDSLLANLRVKVPLYAHQSGAYFGLLRGYVESCPHASVHLSNMSGTRRLLSFLVVPEGKTLDIDMPSSTVQQPTSTSSYCRPSPGPLLIEVPSTTTNSQRRDTVFPTWATQLRPWTLNQSKELGNYYYLLCHMLLQSNFDQFRNSSPPSSTTATSQTTRLRLFPRPGTARWLGFSSLATSSGTLNQSSVLRLPPQLRFVGMFLLVEAVIRAYVENPHAPTPPQKRVFHDEALLISETTVTSSAGLLSSSSKNSSYHEEAMTLRETLMDVLVHLTRSWWVPSAAFISILLSLIRTRPPIELRLYFDLVKYLLRIRDELQPTRILSVLCGLRGPAWCLRPDRSPATTATVDSTISEIVDGNDQHLFGDAGEMVDTVADSGEGQQEVTNRYPQPPNYAHSGLLVLITKESSLDPRRAYHYMKFLVELALENSVVVEGLAHFPDLWGPAVDWLRTQIETPTFDGGVLGTRRRSSTATTRGGVTFTNLTTVDASSDAVHRNRPRNFSGPTLTEAVKMLATMPCVEHHRTLQTHREVEPEVLPHLPADSA